jgi:hypothetical protein
VVDFQGYRGSDDGWVRGPHTHAGRTFNVGGYVVVGAFWLLLVLGVLLMLRQG